MFRMEYLNILNLNQDFLLPSLFDKKRVVFFLHYLTHPTDASSSSTFDG